MTKRSREQTSYAVGLIFAVQADARSGMIGSMKRRIDAGELSRPATKEG